MRYLPFFILLLITTINISCTKTPTIEVENNNTFIVYPNPCFDICNASLYNPSSSNYTITIFDTHGKEMKKVQDLTSSANIRFDMSNEVEGKYIAIASNGINTYSVTFLKVKR
jgi:Secretion system C-terminal sorting domain